MQLASTTHNVVQDTNHCHNNGLNEGIASAGYKPSLDVFTGTANFAYGPHHKSSFHEQMLEACVEIATNLSPNDSLLLRFWPDICKDKDFITSEETGVEARVSFLSGLPASKVNDSMQQPCQRTCASLSCANECTSPASCDLLYGFDQCAWAH
jgi:hypothetical protein